MARVMASRVKSLTRVRASTLYVGRRAVVREGKRFKIYLPSQFNELWEELQGRKVRVYIVVDDEG